MNTKNYAMNPASLMKFENKTGSLSKGKKKSRKYLLDKMEHLTALIIERLKTPAEHRYLKTEEVKKILNISTSTLLTLRANGILPYYKINGTIYFKFEEIEAAIEKFRLHHQY